jgi:hypothetical protein
MLLQLLHTLYLTHQATIGRPLPKTPPRSAPSVPIGGGAGRGILRAGSVMINDAAEHPPDAAEECGALAKAYENVKKQNEIGLAVLQSGLREAQIGSIKQGLAAQGTARGSTVST